MSGFPPIDSAINAMKRVNWKQVGANALSISITIAAVIAVIATLLYRGVKKAIVWYNNGGKEQLIEVYEQATYLAITAKESAVIAWVNVEQTREKFTEVVVNIWWAKLEPTIEQITDVIELFRSRQLVSLGQ